MSLDPKDDDSRNTLATLPVPEQELEPPTSPQRIGRYIIIERLAVGGMGLLFKASDVQLNREVVIKRLRHLAPQTATSTVRLLREAQALAKLSHPNVVTVFEVGDCENDVFIAMELLVGNTLSDWLKLRSRTTPEIIAVMIQAGRGLSAAHRATILHRDFKPDNIIVTDDGRVKLIDFGISWTNNSDYVDISSTLQVALSGERVTQTGAVIGTPGYIAPERFGGHQLDVQSDQFAFAAVVYEALAGRRLFDRCSPAEFDAASFAQKLARDLDAIPRRIRPVLRKGLAWNPTDRFSSMEALLAALDVPSRSLASRAMVPLLVAALILIALLVSMNRRMPRNADGAAAWEQVVIPGITGEIGLSAVWGSSPADLWAIGYRGTIIRSRDGGGHWTLVPSGSNAHLFGLWGSPGGGVYAAGAEGVVLHAKGDRKLGLIAQSSLMPTDIVTSVWVSSEGEAYLTVKSESGGFLLRGDERSGWHRQLEVKSALQSAYGRSPKDVWVSGVDGLLFHRDESNTWAQVSSPALVDADLFNVWVSPGGRVYLVGSDKKQPGQAVALRCSSDTCVREALPSTAGRLFSNWGTGDDDVYAVGRNGVILHRSQKGWRVEQLGGNTLTSVWGVDAHHVFAAGNSGVLWVRKQIATAE